MNDPIKALATIRSKINCKTLNALVFCLVILLSLKSTVIGLSPDRESEVKDRIQRIISSSQFSTAEKKSGKTVPQIITQALKNFWNWLTGKVDKEIDKIGAPKGSATGDTVGTILLIALKILCILLLFAFLGAVIFFIFKGLKRSKRIKEIKDAQLLHSLKDPGVLENRAMEYAGKGQFRLAVRYLYISMLLSMNEANIIRIDKSKTNKQYLSEIRMNHSEKYDLAMAFTEEFNRSWYGNREVNKEQFDYWQKNYHLLVGGGAG